MVLLPIILWLGGTVQEMTVKQGIMGTQLQNIKDLAINRSNDRYTGSQASARKELIDEWRVQMTARCNVNQSDIHSNQQLINYYHSHYGALDKE